MVGKVLVVFDSYKLGSLLGISCDGFLTCQKNRWSDLPRPLKPQDIVHKFSGNPSRSLDSKVFKKSMTSYHKFQFAFVIKNIVPCQECRDAASYLDFTLMELLDQEMSINILGIIISYLTKVANDVKQNHSLPYGLLLTKVFETLGVRFTSLEYYSAYDALDLYETRRSRQDTVVGGPGYVAGTTLSQGSRDMANLLLENDRLRLENEQLKA